MKRKLFKTGLPLKLRLKVYRYLSLAEVEAKISLLSKKERESQQEYLQYLKRHETLFVQTWNAKDNDYVRNNKIGRCLAHDRRLMEFKREAIE